MGQLRSFFRFCKNDVLLTAAWTKIGCVWKMIDKRLDNVFLLQALNQMMSRTFPGSIRQPGTGTTAKLKSSCDNVQRLNKFLYRRF